METTIQFMLFGYFSSIAALFVYLHTDRTAYKELKRDIVKYVKQNEAFNLLANQQKVEIDSLRSIIKNQRLDVELVQEHFQKYKDQMFAFNNDLTKIKAKFIPRKHIIEFVNEKKKPKRMAV